MQPKPTVVGREQEGAVLAALVAALAGDPFARFLYPDAAQYHEHFPAFASAFAGRSFESQAAWMAGAAAALWLPPGEWPAEIPIVSLIASTVAAPRQAEVFELIDLIVSAHPRAPHWYLPLVGVAPELQGRGIGSSLIGASLAAIDEQRTAAYFVATSRLVVPLFEKFEFGVERTLRTETSPEVYAMVRPARK
ncbi:MAG: GNAT family N-acetyltransferase [Bryobacteraceae bacterium]